MAPRIRLLLPLIVAMFLAACSAAPAGPTPSAAPPATPASAAPSALPVTAQATGTPMLPSPTPEPDSTATGTPSPPSPTGAPTSVTQTAAPLVLAPPTATPVFPEARLSADNLATLRPLRAVGFGGALSAAISPDNRLLAVATTAGVALFELPGLRHLRFDPIEGGAGSLSFSPDGQRLSVAIGRYQTSPIQVRRVADGAILEPSAPAEPEPPLVITMPPTLDSPDGRLRITYNIPDSMPNPGVRLSRIADGQLLYEDMITEQAAFSPDSSLLVLVAYDGTVTLCDAGGATLTTLALPAYWSVAFSPDGLHMATAGRWVWLWDVVSGELRQELADLAGTGEGMITGGRQRISFSPDGSLLSVDGEYFIFEATLRRASTWRLGTTGAVHAWDSEAGASGLMNYETYVSALSLVSEAVARTDDGQTLTITGGAFAQTLVVSAGVSALTFSPDGALLAVGDKSGQVQLLRLADGVTPLSLQADTVPRVLQFSPDGALLGARGEDGALRIWSVADGASQGRIAAPPLEPGAAPDRPRADPFRFTPDGAMVVSWGHGPVRFYRLSDGQLLHQIDISADDVALGPRQRLLGIISGGRVELWGLPPGP